MRESLSNRLAAQQTWLAGPEQTRAAGRALASALTRTRADEVCVIALRGELGAGKTTFVGGFLAALGFHGPVRSPTYTLIEPYALAGIELHHLDLYRLNDPSELEELGVRDLMQPGAVLLVEWPERAGAALRTEDVLVELSYATERGEGRVVTVTASSEIGKRLVDSTDFSTIGE